MLRWTCGKTMLDMIPNRVFKAELEVESIIHKMRKGRLRCSMRNTKFFSVEVGLHQGSAISPYLFSLILDELSRGIQRNIPWSMVFADDIVLVAESADALNMRLES
uniref:Polyprotein, putative n=1 Tax=Tanacetum cinerariifolium TaxID=118510 RepID=A0A699T3I8_TANCI|nr:polyprotein, putative [Tanacetum cinerariifolium]